MEYTRTGTGDTPRRGVGATPHGGRGVGADRGNRRIQCFSATGQFLGKWGSEGSGDGQFYIPNGVAVAPNGRVYVADSGNNRIQAFGTTYPVTWRGEYFANPWLSEPPILIREEAEVSFNWGTGSPGPDIPTDDFSARWQRYVPFEAGNYRFTVFADDGVRLWVDDRLLIEQWQDQAATYSADISLTQGYHRVRLEYYDDRGSAAVRLSWTAADTTPPAAVTDLAVTTGCASGTVILDWTAPGDDGNIGTATEYVVRYAAAPIVSQFGWLLATDVDGEPTPQPAGTRQSMVVSGLTPGQTYYFAIVTRDEAGNEGGLSNSPGAMAGIGPDLSISSIEVTQGIQCLNNPNCFGDQQLYNQYCGEDNPNCDNAVPLVAGRPTWVRVYVDIGPTECSVAGVTARLHGQASTHSLEPLSPDNGSISAPKNPDQGRWGHSLNFRLPSNWFIDGSLTLYAEVDPDNQIPEANDDNNTSDTQQVTFHPASKPAIAYVPVTHHGVNAGELPDRSRTSFLRLYPVGGTSGVSSVPWPDI